MDPTRAPGRRYRRRRPGEPVNPEWTAPHWTATSLADPPPVDNPLAGVLGETWQEYRRHAARLLPFAAAGVVVAIVATELVRLVAGRFNPLVALLLELPAAWLVIKLVEFLLRGGDGRHHPRERVRPAVPRLPGCGSAWARSPRSGW